jgi:hypothetical protein
LKSSDICWVGIATEASTRELRADESDNWIRLNCAFARRFGYGGCRGGILTSVG